LVVSFVIILDYTYEVKKGKFDSVIKYVILESLKLSSDDANGVHLLSSSSHQFKNLIHKSKKEEITRREAGFLLRAVGPFWKQAVIVALVNELPPFEGDVIQALSESFNSEAVNLIQLYEGFIEQIDRWNLNNVWELKNLVNGNQLMEMYERKAGPWLAEALEKRNGLAIGKSRKGKTGM